MRALGYIDKISVFDIAHAARDRAVFGDCIAQLIAHHGVLALLPAAAEEIVHCLVRPGSVKVIGIDDRKRPVHNAAAAQHRMSRSPGLFPSLGDSVALGQFVELLIDVFHVKILFHAEADGGLEALLYLALYDERDLTKACAVSVEKRKVNYRVALGIDGGYLLESAEAAAHSGSHYNKRRLLHITYRSDQARLCPWPRKCHG